VEFADPMRTPAACGSLTTGPKRGLRPPRAQLFWFRLRERIPPFSAWPPGVTGIAILCCGLPTFLFVDKSTDRRVACPSVPGAGSSSTRRVVCGKPGA
jgi:hypothetical protein